MGTGNFPPTPGIRSNQGDSLLSAIRFFETGRMRVQIRLVSPTPRTLCASSTKRLSRATGNSKGGARPAIQMSESVESMILEAAPRNPEEYFPE